MLLSRELTSLKIAEYTGHSLLVELRFAPLSVNSRGHREATTGLNDSEPSIRIVSDAVRDVSKALAFRDHQSPIIHRTQPEHFAWL